MTMDRARQRLGELQNRIKWYEDFVDYYRKRKKKGSLYEYLKVIHRCEMKINQLKFKYFFGEL